MSDPQQQQPADAATESPVEVLFDDLVPVAPPRALGLGARILAKLAGHPEEFELNQRVVNAFVLLFAILGVVGVIVDSASGMEPEMVVVDICFATIEAVLYYAFRVRHMLKRFVVPAMVGPTLLIVWYWFRFDGIDGSAPYLLFLAALMPVTVARGSTRLWLVAGYNALAMALFALEYSEPGLIFHTFESDGQRILDLSTTFLMVFTLMAALTMALSRAYDDVMQALDGERRRADLLLLNVMPASMLARLKKNPRGVAQHHEAVTVLFADIEGFTRWSADHQPREVLGMLNGVFGRFDALCAEHGVEKIKTVGDGYVAAAGVPEARADHALAMARVALAMQRAVRDDPELLRGLGLRIGLHSGPVFAGVLRTTRLAYDLWGNAVNVACRMESSGVAGRIHVSDKTRALLGDSFRFESRGVREIRSVGELETFFLEEKGA
jgi:class 3 adenylate cyclase